MRWGIGKSSCTEVTEWRAPALCRCSCIPVVTNYHSGYPMITLSTAQSTQ